MALALKLFTPVTLTGVISDITAPTASECYKRVMVSNPTGATISVTLYIKKGAAADAQFGDLNYQLEAGKSNDWGLCILENGDKLRGIGNGAVVIPMGFTE